MAPAAQGHRRPARQDTVTAADLAPIVESLYDIEATLAAAGREA